MTRCAVACRAEDVSARSAGLLVLQLLFKLATPGTQADRLLNGPTNEVWLDPWLSYLKSLNVNYFTGETVSSFACDGTQITGVEVCNRLGVRRPITADYYIAAIPGDKMKDLVGPLLRADPGLGNIGNLTFEWMNGIQFFLKNDVKMASGHVMYFDSKWALTSISQQQFWSKRIGGSYGDGTINGILSVDISEWDEKGVLHKKTAKQCTADEIKEEVLNEISRHQGKDGKSIFNDPGDIGDWMLDPDILIRPYYPTDNLEPLLVTVKNSWPLRPQAITRIKNLFLASDYVQTSTDAVTMEGANEAARRAVNGVLDAVNDLSKRCTVFELTEPFFLELLRGLDKMLFDQGLRNPFDMPYAELISDGGLNWFTREFQFVEHTQMNQFRRGIEMQRDIVKWIEQREESPPEESSRRPRPKAGQKKEKSKN